VPDGGLLIGRPQRTNGRETNPKFCSALFRFRRTQAIDSAWRSFRLETIAQSKWGFMGSTGYESEGNGRYSVYSTSVLSEGRRENSTCFHDFGCSALDALVFCFQLKRNLPSCWLRVRFSSPAPCFQQSVSDNGVHGIPTRREVIENRLLDAQKQQPRRAMTR
jgi:hypothetical protein